MPRQLVIGALLLAAATATPPPGAAQDAPPEQRSHTGRMLTGAVIGGWFGYFASHVVVSDWQDRSGVSSYRQGWAAVGLLVGALGARLTAPNSPATRLRPVVAPNRRTIERDDIVSSGATNAWDLIRSARSDWLVPRGTNSFRETARGSADFGQPASVTPGIDQILVYLDNTRLGGTQQLAEIDLASIGRIEFVEGAQATWRWGAGHAHGVILLSSLPRTSSRP